MKACEDNKLKSCLIEMMEQEEASLKEELQHTEPHVFSPEYRQAIAKAVRTYKRKKAMRAAFRYVAAAAVVALLTGGAIFISSENLRASNMGIDILEWLEEFFSLEDGNHIRKEEEILFDESQIGYLPEGFEKVNEFVSYAYVQKEYEDGKGNYIQFFVYRGKFEIQFDNEEIDREIRITEDGLEYTYIYKKDENSVVLIWKDDSGYYYKLEGSIEENELIKMMNKITYLED